MTTATKTFSGRADAGKLSVVDEIARRELGMSYGKYCGSVLLDSICRTGELPTLVGDLEQLDRRHTAIDTLKSFSLRAHDAAVGRMTDAQIEALIASRYE